MTLWRQRARLAFGCAFLLACLVGAWFASSLVATSGTNPYEVPVVTDINPDPDIVETTITAEPAVVDIGGGNLASVLTFNGTVPGPEFRLKVGDTVIVHFENNIGHNTGIHWHGIELANASDGTPLSQNQVPPNEKFIYKFTVTRPGIFWYHPHHHSSTNQVFKGLYGSIIVTDPNEDDLIGDGVIPDAAHTRTLVLTDITVCEAPGAVPSNNPSETYDSSLPHVSGLPLVAQQGPHPDDLCELSPIDEDGNPRGPYNEDEVPNIQKSGTSSAVNEGNIVLTNGMNVGARGGTPAAPGSLALGAHTLDVVAGEGLRLQLVNAATARFFRLRMTDSAGTMIPLMRIGGQGGILDHARSEGGIVSGFDFKYDSGQILLDPGDRADVVAAIPTTAVGPITMWTEDFRRSGAGWLNLPTAPVMHLNVTSIAASSYTIAVGTPLRAAYPGSEQEQLVGPFASVLDPATFAPPKDGMGTNDIWLTNVSSKLGINEVQGKHDAAGDYTAIMHEGSARFAHLGDTLELTVTNQTGAHHPFHLHGFSIQPISLVDTIPGAPAAGSPDASPGTGPSYTFGYSEFKDNIDVPGGYTLTFRLRLEDRPLVDGTTMGGGMGRWVFHCHIFFHAVFGMISEFVTSAADGKERPYVNVNFGEQYQEANAGDMLSVSGTIVDTDGDAVTLSSSLGTVTDNGGGTWTWDYTTTGAEGTQFVYITATDANGLKDQALFHLAVNGPPTVTVDDAAGAEGAAVPIHGSVVDPDGDPVTHTWAVTANAGVDPGATCVIADPNALDTTVTCTDDGVFTLTLTASDGINAPVADTGALTLSNVAPTISLGSPPSGSVYVIGSTVSVVANVADPGTNDTLTCSFFWDGGGPNSASAAGAGVCSQSNAFAAAGVYTSTVTVADDDGGVGGPITVVIVVYNPDSKMTGGGIANSPLGALVSNPAAVGTGQFEFNPNYLPRATIPSGKARFAFRSGGLDFTSNLLEWLVVTGNRGQLRGSGTVNSGGDYGFLLTVVDGGTGPAATADRFRLKIWDKSAGDAVVYDTTLGGAEDIDLSPTVPIVNGSIVVHRE
jgi:FtsP/CotA-like multicopper oxidase with cupredoxin domain